MINPEKLNRVRDEYDGAEISLNALSELRPVYEKKREWGRFLRSFKSFFTQCEQLVKTDNELNAWFGTQKSIFKNDQLVTYLFKSRDVLEHSAELPVSFSFSVEIAKGGTRLFGRPGSSWAGDIEPEVGDENITDYRLEASSFRHPRDQKVYDPPKMHLGLPINGVEIDLIGQLGLSYMSQMLDVLYARAETLRKLAS